jgi:hypothetical protein
MFRPTPTVSSSFLCQRRRFCLTQQHEVLSAWWFIFPENRLNPLGRLVLYSEADLLARPGSTYSARRSQPTLAFAVRRSICWLDREGI